VIFCRVLFEVLLPDIIYIYILSSAYFLFLCIIRAVLIILTGSLVCDEQDEWFPVFMFCVILNVWFGTLCLPSCCHLLRFSMLLVYHWLLMLLIVDVV
jgi:hypothetical protein